MPLDQEATGAEILVPPRPNLGPEPWPDQAGWPGAAWWWGSGLGLLLLVALWGWRRRRAKSRSPGPIGPDDPSAEADRSPRQRLIASSEVVRGALIGAFGPAWGSKTTEEILADPKLVGRFEPSEVERLVSFLRLADRVKFAEAEPDPLDGWDAWAFTFASGVGAGATSRINGK